MTERCHHCITPPRWGSVKGLVHPKISASCCQDCESPFFLVKCAANATRGPRSSFQTKLSRCRFKNQRCRRLTSRRTQHLHSHTRTAVLPQCICSVLWSERQGCRCGVGENIVSWSRTCLLFWGFFLFFSLGLLCSRVRSRSFFCNASTTEASLPRARGH